MLKRAFDLIIAGLGLIVLSPVFVIIALWIKLDSSGPVFFRQERVGRHGELFLIHKFRTMHVRQTHDAQITVGNDVRVTSAGNFMRKYKLDELPQLIDVLTGKMSLVGPRPEVPRFMDFYPLDVRNKVLSVRPGITDLASIEMIDENQVLASYPDPERTYIDTILPLKQKYYLDYVENRTFFDDIKIVFLTLKKVVSR